MYYKKLEIYLFSIVSVLKIFKFIRSIQLFDTTYSKDLINSNKFLRLPIFSQEVLQYILRIHVKNQYRCRHVPKIFPIHHCCVWQNTIHNLYQILLYNINIYKMYGFFRFIIPGY